LGCQRKRIWFSTKEGEVKKLYDGLFEDTINEWAEIPGLEKYQVSRDGQIRHGQSKRPRKLKPMKGVRKNYLGFSYREPGLKSPRTMAVHEAVAKAFLILPDDWMSVEYDIDHIDHDTENNKVDNLRWRERSENRADNGREYGRVNEGDVA
jgi:hypothetical protein